MIYSYYDFSKHGNQKIQCLYTMRLFLGRQSFLNSIPTVMGHYNSPGSEDGVRQVSLHVLQSVELTFTSCGQGGSWG